MSIGTPSQDGGHSQSHHSWSFIQGLLLGQLSIVLLLGAFVKFFISGDGPTPDATTAARLSARRQRAITHKASLGSLTVDQQRSIRKKYPSVLWNPPLLTTASILTKTYYNVNSHQPESVDWLNVLVAQALAQLRSDAEHDDALLASLNKALNGPRRPDFLDEIKITELSLGDEFPIFSNCRISPAEEDDDEGKKSSGRGDVGRLQARMDVDLSDSITLGVETKLILNYPKPKIAVLPVALAVSVERFTATLSISFIPSFPTAPSPTSLTFTFLDDYRLDLSTRSLLGSRTRLQDVPKIAQIIESRLHAWFDERCVEPRFQQIVLPNLWPRKENTRGGEDEMVGGAGESDLNAGAETGRGGLGKQRAGHVDLLDRVEEPRRRARWQGNDQHLPGAMPGFNMG